METETKTETTTIATKKCGKCALTLPTTAFYKQGKYYQSYCKECLKTATKSKYVRHAKKSKLEYAGRLDEFITYAAMNPSLNELRVRFELSTPTLITLREKHAEKIAEKRQEIFDLVMPQLAEETSNESAEESAEDSEQKTP